MKHDWPELSDLVVDFDPETLQRRPVEREAVLAELDALGSVRGRRIVEAIPHRDGLLDPAAVDQELVGCHYEIQRLALELQQGPRMARSVRRALEAVRAVRPAAPLRVVDVGCGIGYVLRWMAGHPGCLPTGTELIGADFNPALITEARRLAKLEQLAVEFHVANAFQLERPATVFISSGVLHHIPRAALPAFFAAQAGAPVSIHADFQQSRLGPIGAWLMHAARMQRPLARFDGVLSAVRAYPGEVLVTAARAGLPDRRHQLEGTHLIGPIRRAMHAIVSHDPAVPW